LLDRKPTGVSLTQAGEVYASEARRALETIERAGLQAKRAAKGEMGRLSIAMNDLAARNVEIAKRIAAFSEAYPEIQLEFSSMISMDQLNALKSNKIDAGILLEGPLDDSL